MFAQTDKYWQIIRKSKIKHQYYVNLTTKWRYSMTSTFDLIERTE